MLDFCWSDLCRLCYRFYKLVYIYRFYRSPGLCCDFWVRLVVVLCSCF